MSTPLLRTFPLPSQRPINRGVPPAARRGGAVVPPHLPEVCAPLPPPPRRPPRRTPAPPAAASQRWRRPGAGAASHAGGPRAATPALIFRAAPRRRRCARRYIRMLAARLIFREPPGVRAGRGGGRLRRPGLQKNSDTCKSAPSRGLPAAAISRPGAQPVMVPKSVPHFRGFARGAAEHQNTTCQRYTARPPASACMRCCLLPPSPRWTDVDAAAARACAGDSLPHSAGRTLRTAATRATKEKHDSNNAAQRVAAQRKREKCGSRRPVALPLPATSFGDRTVTETNSTSHDDTIARL